MNGIKKKAGLCGLILLLSVTAAGCSSDRIKDSEYEIGTGQTKIYNGTTTVHTSTGSWTPPKGSRRLADGSIIDSEGCVIGHDGTWRNTGKGVG